MNFCEAENSIIAQHPLQPNFISSLMDKKSFLSFFFPFAFDLFIEWIPRYLTDIHIDRESVIDIFCCSFDCNIVVKLFSEI